jgi:hypothetical protein
MDHNSDDQKSTDVFSAFMNASVPPLPKWLAILRIWAVPGSNLGPETDYTD